MYQLNYIISIRGKITKLLNLDVYWLKKELKKAINKEEDCVSIIKLQSEDSFDEEILGSQKEGNEDSLII